MRKRLVLPSDYFLAEQGRGRFLVLRRTSHTAFGLVAGPYADRYLAVRAAYKDKALSVNGVGGDAPQQQQQEASA